MKEGDVIIIHDGKKSRTLWSVAKIEKVLLSKDNEVRGATIKYFIIVINRTISKLYRLNQ